jgi:hypothetical protein
MWFGIAGMYINLPMPLALSSDSLDVELMWHVISTSIRVYWLICLSFAREALLI